MIILGSFGFSYIITRKKLSELIHDKTRKLLIIPLASSSGAIMGNKEKETAVLTGFDKQNITIFDESEPEKIKDINFDYIAVPGGNTFRLLYYVKKFGLDKFITEQVKNGAVYMGFSAGAYLACKNIEYVKCFDDNNHILNGDFTALGLTNKYVLCHYNLRGLAEIKMCRQFIGKDSELITITDEDLIVL